MTQGIVYGLDPKKVSTETLGWGGVGGVVAGGRGGCGGGSGVDDLT